MIYSVFDLEADAINATKIHCVSITRVRDDEVSKYCLTDYTEMKRFFLEEKTLVGHNIIRYDIPVAERILGIKITARLIDTLPLSWYLYPNRITHGLDGWGRDMGIEKPPITDWQNLSLEEYTHRCNEDVRINYKLFKEQLLYLKGLYSSGSEIDRLLSYLSYKMDCAREQEEVKWRLDEEICKTNFEFLSNLKDEKYSKLASVMPRTPIFKVRSKPKVTHCKDGSLSELGKKWFSLLDEMQLPDYHNGAIKIVDTYEEGNPNSTSQLKDWLTSLGWEPETFVYVKDSMNGKQVNRPIPQIMSDDGTGVCASIKRMFPSHPELIALEDYSILKHRVGLLKGFLRDVDSNGFLSAEISGLTNTLRFQHKTIVNLPQIPKKYWRKIRECLIAPNSDYILCGADMTGLEDNTKQHYMYYFDANYVKEMRVEGFDPHLDIAVLSNLLTKQQAEEHKLYDRTEGKEGKSYKATRLKAKKVNFACVYGAGAPKISVTANIPLHEAGLLHNTYWLRNKAVKEVAASTIVKTVNQQMWQFNPVSKFWYALRANKDRFSTLNQGTGVYCFDTWVRKVREKGWKICGQFHDEIILPVEKEEVEMLTICLNKAIEEANEILKLNVPLKISVAFGDRYSNIH